MGLPPHPATLRIHPSRMSADAASLSVIPAAGEGKGPQATWAATVEAETTEDPSARASCDETTWARPPATSPSQPTVTNKTAPGYPLNTTASRAQP
jgi:hypothetical protein